MPKPKTVKKRRRRSGKAKIRVGTKVINKDTLPQAPVIRRVPDNTPTFRIKVKRK